MNKELKTVIAVGIFIFMLAIGIISGINPNEEIAVNAEALSNKKIEWGIQKKNNHEQPELGSKNKELITKYNGLAMGSPNKNYIYLTFDLGYEAGYTSKILDVLRANNVQGVFFITSHYVNTAPDLVKRMIDEGHIVGNQLPQT